MGMIIVRDPPGTLPKFLEGGEYDGEGPVPEVELVILGLTVKNNKDAANGMAECCKADPELTTPGHSSPVGMWSQSQTKECQTKQAG